MIGFFQNKSVFQGEAVEAPVRLVRTWVCQPRPAGSGLLRVGPGSRGSGFPLFLPSFFCPCGCCLFS
jgi:hypothetical protein